VKWQEYPYYFENLDQHLSRIDAKKQSLDSKRPLPTYALKSIKESLSLEWTFNSNGIEGNTLTLQETKLIIEEGITIKGKSLREHFEDFNHQNAI
jgi:Fic family protein